MPSLFTAAAARFAALQFWRDCYLDGTRITIRPGSPTTHDGAQFVFERVDGNPGIRLQRRRQYGVFVLEGIEAPADVAQGVQAHGVHLLHWLAMPVCEKYRDWFWHLLIKDYEFEPLIAACANTGQAINGTPLDGGWFAQVSSCPVEVGRKKFVANRHPPVMEGVYAYAKIENILANNVEPMVRKNSPGAHGRG